ncbi:MAG TPA: PaaI family thioesterase [Acidimicrobiales bacterium]|nr:PaaI family thioesterase [Acidimicrobiales bacterium]
MTGEYVRWPYPSPLLDAIGGFERDPADPARVAFDVDPPKVNARGFLHTGVIASVADVAIGHLLSDLMDPPAPLVTVNLSCDLLGSARLGERVQGVVEATRVGRRLAAGVAVFSTDRTIARITALFVPASPAPR